jgi:2-keto-4-pentenoate hydratase/2-oxohepta-3-ene-1,7-dioic acid hydratase in catechol pathway
MRVPWGRDPPFLFQKPSDAVVPNRSTLKFPAMTENLHHEIELVGATVSVLSIAANGAHQMTWLCIQKLCVNNGEEP